MRRLWFSIAALAFVVACAPDAPRTLDAEYMTALDEYRGSREERLRSTDGWLTLAGLFWLEPGENRFGSDPDNAIVLEAPGVPGWAGTLHLEDQVVRLESAPNVSMTIDGQPVADRELRNDNEESTDILELERLRFHVIRRSDRFGVRVKDPEHPALAGFKGLEFFPADAAYRIEAQFTPYAEPKPISILSVIGTTEKMVSPGLVQFSIDGKRLSLEPVVEDPADTDLWFIFKDETSGTETYGFRYLWGKLQDGKVDIDFNRTYNPPCAFTPYATCPLPPKENQLAARIESGEKIYKK